MSTLLLKPSPWVEGLRAYVVPRPSELIDLSLNGTERPVWSSELLALAAQLAGETACRYPEASALEELLATRLHVEPARVFVTAGADEALDRACRALLAPGRELITSQPTFEMIGHYGRLTGAALKTVPWLEGAYPVDEVLALVNDNTALIAVVTPNNPTGLAARANDIQRLALGAPQALIVVDMAYAEFAEEDLTQTVLALSNTLMVRTLSKAWGMPGLRIGYAVGNATVIGWLRAAGGPYSVARPSLALAQARVTQGAAEVQTYVERVRQERQALTALLTELGADVQPSQANFVLSHFADATWVQQALASLGIGIKAFANQPMLERARRITCPADPAAFVRLSAALRTALQPEALLFDMDGVLADVSKSYRQAIVATAREFGVELGPTEIADAKAAGGANNDWELTHRLLANHGVCVTLAAVTDCFERLYQGTEAQPGLRSTERLLTTAAYLSRLATRMPLAVVTGRPRADAERFLRETGIAHCMTTLVCMEDAPLKPDPAPVRLALTRLGVQRAWMLGDTPDDIRAARRAGVVPVGVVAPGDVYERATQVLLGCGAARVLADVNELEGLLP